MERFNVPGVIGFVDGTHIAITKPKVDVEHQYMNRKGYHSKNVQIVLTVILWWSFFLI